MLYILVLYSHVLAAMLLASALSLEVLAFIRLRKAEAAPEARLWIELIPQLPVLTIVSGLALLFSGGYLTMRMSAGTLAWPKAAVLAMFLIAPLGAASQRRIKAIRQVLADERSQSSARLRDPFLKLSLSIRVWLLAGILFLMTAKPGRIESLLAVRVPVVLGGFWGLLGSRRGGVPTALSANLSK